MAGAERGLPEVNVTRETVDGLAALTLRSSALTVTTVPELGGKIVSIRLRGASGAEEEVLWRNPTRSLMAPHYDAQFEEYDASGYDECFPGIGAGPFPARPWAGVHNPDHGEVWALPWRVDHPGIGEPMSPVSMPPGGPSVRLVVHGVRFPYVLEREITFRAPDRLALRYRATNHASVELPYIWSAHPLFAVTPTTRLFLPPAVTALTVDSSIGERLGRPYATVPWPMATDIQSRPVDLSRLAPGAGYGDKLYTTTSLEDGWGVLFDEETGAYVGFAFDPRDVPYLGVWINQDGWPSSGPTCFNVALEPCTGWPDDLGEAARRGTMRVLPPYGSHTWTVVLAAGHVSSLADLKPLEWLHEATDLG